jgi:mannitol/fructose-specific phosphotransferase system IIA component (Ntr-type)
MTWSLPRSLNIKRQGLASDRATAKRLWSSLQQYSISIRDWKFGIYHPHTSTSYDHNKGFILFKMRDPLALEHAQNALAIRESVLVPYHAKSMKTLDLLKRLLGGKLTL